MTLQAFALLCALATLASVAGAVRPAQLTYVLAGIAVSTALMIPALVGLPLAPLVTVEPTQVALLLALFALARLRNKVDVRIALFVGGALAVVWLQALRGTGWPLFAAFPFVMGVVAIAAFAGLQRNFFPALLQEEVALLMLAGGLIVALVPGVLEGWDSAEALQGSMAAEAEAGTKVVWIAAGFVVLGALFAWWKSNRGWSR
jgi:hypothetical protein